MKQIFAYENIEQYQNNIQPTQYFIEKLEIYRQILEKEYELHDIPKTIVWTSEEIATNIFSTVPIPAYTNKDIIYMNPNLEEWRQLFLRQLEGLQHVEIEEYYKTISNDHIFCILAHELTHHSDLFLDEFDDDRMDSIWFEEGMCEYLSKKLTLNENQFDEIAKIELELILLFKDKYGKHSLDDFGTASYKAENITSIMYDYWRSFQTIKYLVEERSNNNIHHVFEVYHRWHKEGRKISLTQYFNLDSFLNSL
ncbi:hypothetical protein [Lysinibacillus xylanilyticus]|uniref:hypothetical protein n=1 Tax=Lysinibacillus xylanilyticus TaxID=582475 RepID=UPI0037F79DC4